MSRPDIQGDWQQETIKVGSSERPVLRCGAMAVWERESNWAVSLAVQNLTVCHVDTVDDALIIAEAVNPAMMNLPDGIDDKEALCESLPTWVIPWLRKCIKAKGWVELNA